MPAGVREERTPGDHPLTVLARQLAGDESNRRAMFGAVVERLEDALEGERRQHLPGKRLADGLATAGLPRARGRSSRSGRPGNVSMPSG
jgi:hypothetical protein